MPHGCVSVNVSMNGWKGPDGSGVIVSVVFAVYVRASLRVEAQGQLKSYAVVDAGGEREKGASTRVLG